MQAGRRNRGPASLITAFAVAMVVLACGGGGDDVPASQTMEYSVRLEDPAYVLAGDEEIDRHEAAMIEENLRHEDPDGPRFYQLIKDMGGFKAFDRLLDTGDRARIEAVLFKYKVGYSTSEPGAWRSTIQSTTPPAASSGAEGMWAVPDSASPSASGEAPAAGDAGQPPLNVADCIQFFPAADRGKAFALASHVVFIDSVGRPGYATWKGDPATPIESGSRSTGCQSRVGQWGLPDDDGGHLIPASLGGWGGRANLVPQNASLNRGAWRTVEAVPKACARKFSTSYTMNPQYGSNSDLRPTRLQVKVGVLRSGSAATTLSLINSPNTSPSPDTNAAIRAFQVQTSQACS